MRVPSSNERTECENITHAGGVRMETSQAWENDCTKLQGNMWGGEKMCMAAHGNSLQKAVHDDSFVQLIVLFSLYWTPTLRHGWVLGTGKWVRHHSCPLGIHNLVRVRPTNERLSNNREIMEYHGVERRRLWLSVGCRVMESGAEKIIKEVTWLSCFSKIEETASEEEG